MGDHHNGVLLLQLQGQILNLAGGNGVKGGSWLIHQQDFRFHRQRTGDAQPLLLTTGKTQGIFLQAILQFVPDGGIAQTALNDVIQLGLAADAVGARPEGNVIVDAHGERIGLLEHHTHPLAQESGVDITVNIDAVQQHFAGDFAALHQVVHAVEGFEQRRLAAATGANKGSDLVGMDGQVHALKGMEAAIMQVQTVDLDLAHARFPPMRLAIRADRPLMMSTITSRTTAVA